MARGKRNNQASARSTLSEVTICLLCRVLRIRVEIAGL